MFGEKPPPPITTLRHTYGVSGAAAPPPCGAKATAASTVSGRKIFCKLFAPERGCSSHRDVPSRTFSRVGASRFSP